MSARHQTWSEAELIDAVGECVRVAVLKGYFLRDFNSAKSLGIRMIAELRELGLTVMPRSMN